MSLNGNGNGRTVPLQVVLALVGALLTISGWLYHGVSNRAERAEQKAIATEATVHTALGQIISRLNRIEDKLDRVTEVKPQLFRGRP